MKIRWKEHEIIFVTILVIVQVIIYLGGMYDVSRGINHIDYAKGFHEAGLPFVYWKQVFIPQLGAVLLLFAAYLSVNLLIVPLVKRISFVDAERFVSLRLLKLLAVAGGTAFVLALGINILTFLARPYLFNYAGHGWLSILGYNDRPLSNLLQGFPRAAILIAAATVIAGIRELICRLIGMPGPKRDFRVMVTNNCTPLLFIYLLVLIFLNPLHRDFLLYIGTVTPVFLVYIFTTFWIFPFKGDASFFHGPVLTRILISTFCWSLLAIVSFRGAEPVLFFLSYWAFLLFAIVPLSWLLYRQRSALILQVKGMQTALARSDADLQLLKSQINPHFLFNALNTLYATALQRDSERTAEGIQQLGDMMRFMLEDNVKEFIPMEKEVDYLKNYISLQMLRTLSSPVITVEENLDEVRCDHQVAPMLFIPFVENAFKHGISLKERSWIRIHLECTEESIFFEVRNSIHQRTDLEAGRTGIGLQNVRGRLELLYPKRHELAVSRQDGEFTVKLCIMIRNTSNKKYAASDRH